MKTSKEEVIKLIHMAGSQMDEKATSIQLSGKIMEIVVQLDQFPTEIAVDALKKEFRRTNGRYGMVTMCVGTGQGAAGVIELLN